MAGCTACRHRRNGNSLAGEGPLLCDECVDDGFGAGGVGVPWSVSDRGRLVAVEGSFAGLNAAVFAGRAAHCRAGVLVESGVAGAEFGGVGGARTSSSGRFTMARDLRWPTGPQDDASECGTVVAGDEDHQRECGVGQWPVPRVVVAVVRGAEASASTLGDAARSVRAGCPGIPKIAHEHKRTIS